MTHITYAHRRMQEGYRPVVCIDDERFIDYSAQPFATDTEANIAAKLMVDRLVSSIRSQLRANHFLQKEYQNGGK